jgi:hypothetical protein
MRAKVMKENTIDCMTLVDLPGIAGREPKAPKKPKKQTLNFVNGYAVPRDSNSKIAVAVANAYANAPARGKISNFKPEFVKLDGLVLSFNAYFEEAVMNSQHEKSRFRKFLIYYHLEDNTLMITEPRQANSGIQQGAFLKRSAVPSITPLDFNIGATLKIYGNVFTIYRCDDFTRSYLKSSLGVSVLENLTDPDGAAVADKGAQSSRKAVDTRGKFLTHDKQVLRFYCVWDDKSRYGDSRKFVLQFFLIDDTVSISEAEGSCGGGISTTMLHRSRLPVKDEDAGARGPTHEDFDYITADDLRVGGFVRVYKRDFFIYGADEFTSKWYIDKKGMCESDFATIDVSKPQEALPENRIPPHEGLAIGSEEDSLQNCISLIPKAPRKDIAKEFANDNCVLQFIARMVPVSASARNVDEFDASRSFVVSYYAADDTISIFERASKDSRKSKFLERAKVKKSDGTYYDMSDMFVSAILLIHSRAFKLDEADAYTATYLSQLSGA